MTHNVLIIGAGVSGLSAALTLLLNGYYITLLERGEVGAESSWAGGGILSPLLPWDYSEPLSKLALRSMACYESRINGIESQSGNVTEFTRCGMSVQGLKKPGPALAWCRKHNFAHSPDAPVPMTASGCPISLRFVIRFWLQRFARLF